MPLAIAPGSYNIGLFGADHAQMIRQVVKDWSLMVPMSPPNQFSFSLTGHSKYFRLFGADARIIGDEITMDSTGLAIHKAPLPAHLGFTASFTWHPSDCNSPSGFTFFLTRTAPSDVVVKSDSLTGRLGTASLSSLTSISLSTPSNQMKVFLK